MPSLPRTGIQLPFVEDFAWLRFSNDMYPIVCARVFSIGMGVGPNKGSKGENGWREKGGLGTRSTVSPDTGRGVDSVKMISLVNLSR